MSRKRTLPREILTDDESDRLVEQCGPDPEGMRNRALILLFEGTACRVSEVVALEPRDIDWTEEQANVRHGKGDEQGIVQVAPEALVATRAWLDARVELGIPADVPVCCELDGSPLKPDKVRKTLHKLAKQAGIRKRVHPHGFRHRLSVRLVRAKVPLPSVSAQLRHRNIATTHTYLQRIGASQAIDDVLAALDEE
jgi:integrase